MPGSAIEKTFGFLAKTRGDAALEVLCAAMDVPLPAVRSGALRALLRRRSARAVQELLRRLPGLTDADAAVVREQADRFGRMMGEVVRTGTPEQCQVACRAIVKYRAFGAVSALALGVNAAAEPRRSLFARTLLELAECFYEQLRGLRGPQAREDRAGQRCEIVEQLEPAVRKFHEHRRIEVLEAYFMLASAKSPCVRQLLGDNRGELYRVIAAPLLKSPRGGILRLAMALLEDAFPLPAADDIVSNRDDERFVELLLATVGTRRWTAVRNTLRNVQSIAWATPQHPLLGLLDDAQQAAAVSVLAAASLPRPSLFTVLEHLVVSGRPAGRTAAAKALAAFREPEIDAMFAAWLNHDDPAVRAVAVGQVRPRRGAEAVPLLIGMLDESQPPVLAAIREALPEFSLPRFLVRLKDMPPPVRNSVGRLVAKLAEDPVGKLDNDLKSHLSHVRVRAAHAVAAMGLAGELQDTLRGMIAEDPDKFVRAACAEALTQCAGANAGEPSADDPAGEGNQETLLRAAEMDLSGEDLAEDSVAESAAETGADAEQVAAAVAVAVAELPDEVEDSAEEYY